MKRGHGVFVQWRDGSIRGIAVSDSHGKAQALHGKLERFLKSRDEFGVTPDMAKDKDDRALFAFFEELERGKRESDIVRSGVGEILFFIDCLENQPQE